MIDVPAEPLADADTHTRIRTAIAELGEEDLTELRLWWEEVGFPPIKDADRLTVDQANEVLVLLDKRCECGHAFSVHNDWWDLGDAESNGGPSSGMGCDVCDCSDVRSPS